MRDGETLADVRRRAAQGNAFDQNQLGAFLATGCEGICDKDEAEARYWYLKAVKQGYVESKYNLSVMLIEGAGGPVDVEKAMFLLQQAAVEGEYNSCRFLSAIYEAGEHGKEVDTDLSRYWWREYERIMAVDVEELPDFGTPLPDFELSV